jgi:hypothetical protein
VEISVKKLIKDKKEGYHFKREELEEERGEA